MRVVLKRRLYDRLVELLEQHKAANQEVSHIELTQREAQQLFHEVGLDSVAFKSEGPHETRFFGIRVVIV